MSDEMENNKYYSFDKILWKVKDQIINDWMAFLEKVKL